jgi:hypothetical protein
MQGIGVFILSCVFAYSFAIANLITAIGAIYLAFRKQLSSKATKLLIL